MENLLVKKKLRKSLKRLGLTAQVHGIPKIFNSKRFVFKLMWLFCFIGSKITCLIFLANTVNEYLQYLPVTNIDLIKENPMQFPTVTLCDTSVSVKNYSIQEKIIDCKFNNENCSSDLTMFYDDWMDRWCIQFNGSKYKSSRSGLLYGFRLRLFASQFKEPKKKLNAAELDINGFYVFIHNKSNLPTRDDLLVTSVGTETYFGLRKFIDEKKTEPYNNCINNLDTYHSFDSKLFKEFSKNNLEYRQKDCLDYAITSMYLNCSDSLTNGFNICLSKINNSKELFDRYFSFYERKIFKRYLAYCPVECKTIKYTITSSHAVYPSYEEYLNLLDKEILMNNFEKKNKTSIEELRESVASVYIFFEDLEYTFISQQAKIELWNFISNIGGVLSLFLGFSFLSLIDIVQIGLEIVFVLSSTQVIKPN